MNCSMTFLHPYWFIFRLWTATLMACDGNDICFCMVSICHHCSAGWRCHRYFPLKGGGNCNISPRLFQPLANICDLTILYQSNRSPLPNHVKTNLAASGDEQPLLKEWSCKGRAEINPEFTLSKTEAFRGVCC